MTSTVLMTGNMIRMNDDGKTYVVAKLTPDSYGVRRVDVTFNPAGRADVDLIKKMAAALMEVIHEKAEALVDRDDAVRCLGTALDHVETAAMYAVKGVTR